MDISRIITANISSFKNSKTQQNAAGVFMLKVISTGLMFVAAILIARFAGSEGYGAYNFAISSISIFTLFGLFGFHKLIVRQYSRYQTEQAVALQRGIIRRADQIIITLSLLLMLIIWGMSDFITPLFVEEDSTLMITSLLIALPLLPLLALLRVRQATIEATRRAFMANLPEMVLGPVLLVSFVVISWLVLRQDFSVYWALGAKIGSTVAGLLTITWLRRSRLSESIKNAKPVFETRNWIRSAAPLLLISGLYVVNAHTDIIMLGFLGGAESTGFYSAATKGTVLITFIMQAVNKTLSPDFASLYKQEAYDKLQSLVTHSVRVATLIAVLLSVALVAAGHWYLWIFGPAFTVAHLTLAILCIGKVFSVLMGSVGHLLIMTGHESVAAWNVALAVIINIILNYILIPVWGIEGAAVSFAVSLVVVNILQAIAVKKLIYINPTIFRFSS